MVEEIHCINILEVESMVDLIKIKLNNYTNRFWMPYLICIKKVLYIVILNPKIFY
jgi:hypothetical protein